MKNTDAIGLDSKKSQEVVKKLNILLADLSVFYMNDRGFHWNIKGEKFFELHEKFEEIYNDIQEKIDEVAERILMLGETPVHAYSEYIKISNIKEIKNVSEGRKAIEALLEGFKTLLKTEREILDLAGDCDDEGTSALMSDYIREQEKTVWMLSSWMAK